MYRTMEMRVEPKLSYAESLIISGSRKKIWFGYFLFAIRGIFSWLKENLIPSILKLLCFLGILLLITGGALGIVFLITYIPAKIIGWTVATASFCVLIAISQMAIRVLVKETLSDFNRKTSSLKEAALQKLGPSPQLYCELYGPSPRTELQYIRSRIEEVHRHIEEQNEQFLRELENV